MARTKIRGNSQVIDESIVNGQIAPNAAIGRSKLADGTASRVVVNDATGALADSSITSTELDALSGITDNIQDQLDSKVSYGGLKFNVIPSGTINGTNKIFTLNSNVFDDTHLLVFLNGVLQKPTDDYVLSASDEITFVDAPETGDQIVVFYVDDSIAGSGSASSVCILKYDVETTDATETTLAEIDVPEDDMIAFSAWISARGPSDKHFWSKITGGVRRNVSGNATLVDNSVEISGSEGSPAYDVVADVSAGKLRIRVTGEAAETVAWKAKIISDYTGSSGGSSFTPFQWSTTEQVYPFELGPNGETMYAKQVELPALGGDAERGTAHNISNLDVSSVRFFGHQGNIPLNYAHRSATQFAMGCAVKLTQVYQMSGSNLDLGTGYIRIIYSKTS